MRALPVFPFCSRVPVGRVGVTDLFMIAPERPTGPLLQKAKIWPLLPIERVS